MASGPAYMKLQKKRTKLKTWSKVRRISNNEYRMSKDGIAALDLFKNDRIHYSMLDHASAWFDVGRSLVSFLIRLAAFQASGGAEP